MENLHPVVVRAAEYKLGKKLSKDEEARLAIDFYLHLGGTGKSKAGRMIDEALLQASEHIASREAGLQLIRQFTLKPRRMIVRKRPKQANRKVKVKRTKRAK